MSSTLTPSFQLITGYRKSSPVIANSRIFL